jgi:hypothetical protein
MGVRSLWSFPTKGLYRRRTPYPKAVPQRDRAGAAQYWSQMTTAMPRKASLCF